MAKKVLSNHYLEGRVTLNLDDIFEVLVENLSKKELLAFIIRLDDHVCDANFTFDLADHFNKLSKRLEKDCEEEE